MSQVRLLKIMHISAWKIFLLLWINLSALRKGHFTYVISLSAVFVPFIWESVPMIWNLRIDLPNQCEVLKNALFRAVSVLRPILRVIRRVLKRTRCWIQLKYQKSQEFNASVTSRETLLCCETFEPHAIPSEVISSISSFWQLSKSD
jgi:hypothetical protein